MAVTEGGIIGKQNTTTPTSASGMWTLNEVFFRNTISGEWPNFNAPDSVGYNILGGGGGAPNSGSTSVRWGGGAGSVLAQGTFAPTAGITYTVTIGAGGAGAAAGGTSSIVGVANATGGGAHPSSNTGASNASYSGGAGGSGGGGGGAGAAGDGANRPSYGFGGRGGSGASMPCHPTALVAGGGGGGDGDYGTQSGTNGGGGIRDGGAANFGAGAGAKGGSTENGGSGRVIIRYLDTFPAITSTTGSVTITVSGGYRHYDFTSSGSFTF